MPYGAICVQKRIKTQIGDFEKIWREIEKWGAHFFLWNEWSDFFLDRWRRSGVIRMSVAAARAPTILKFRHSCLAPGSLFTRDVVGSSGETRNETVWSTSRILLRTSPAGSVVNVFRLQGTQGVLRDGLYALLLMDLSRVNLISHCLIYRLSYQIRRSKNMKDFSKLSKI